MVLIALLLAPGVLAWSQVGGNAARDEPAIVPGGALDVLSSQPLPGSPGAFWGPGMLPARDGTIAFLHTDGGCELALFETPIATERIGHGNGMCSANLVGYDAPTNAALVCHNAPSTAAVLEAIEATTGEQRWSLVPASAFGTGPEEIGHYCFSAALDPTTREVVLPVMGCCTTRPARLVSIDLDTGDVRWVQRIPTAPALLPVDPGIPQPGQNGYESYHGIALTTTGIVVSGYFDCAGVCEEGVLAWADREGNVVGKEHAVSGSPTQVGPGAYERTRGASQYAVAQGPLAAAALGNEIVIINPEVAQPVARHAIEATSPNTFATFIPKGHWRDDTIVAALGTSFTAFDSATLEQRWSWSEGLDYNVVDSIRVQSGDILAALQRSSDSTVHLVSIDTETGHTRARLQLPVTVSEEDRSSYDGHIVPVGAQGLLYVDERGQRVLIGTAPAGERPQIGLSTEYPAVGEEIRIDVRPPPGLDVRGYEIGWEGDGTVEVATGDTPTHIFAQRGDREVRVVALLADGRTRTATAMVHVGATPPPQLSALQKAFAPENQNLTFGVLGILVTLIGALFTVGRHRRRLARLERELQAVEEIRMLSVQDVRGAVLALKSYRDRLPEDLARRRIDDSQFQILDQRSGRLLKVLRTRLFAPFDAQLSMRYHRLLDAAFEDAIIQPSERLALVGALDGEGIGAAERETIVGILDDFTSGRSDLNNA
ncbi:MAG TPA: hypothetical protein VM370_13785 [Candidatus Thermoplasmatota archaeon]|nr:hypothetical protein [Candidatus Thermoplasmatota archaeon]